MQSLLNIVLYNFSYNSRYNLGNCFDSNLLTAKSRLLCLVKDIQLGITYNKIAQKYNLKKSSIIRIKNIFKIKSPKFKLNEIDVFKIKNLIKEGLSDLEIAKIFNVSKSTIKLIKYEINWKHIKIK